MPTPTKVKRPARPRPLWEALAFPRDDTPPLEVDEDAGVIYRVKVLGRFSRNNHGLTEAENGSEYSPGCMRQALPMYEGAKVKKNHPRDRTQPGKERDVDDTIGVLRNARIENDERGEPAVWADLHYNRAKPFAAELVEDVKRKLGEWGLSHNAAAARERFDRAAKRLVIEELATVRSVDLVDKPATNRNLWESEHRPVNTCLRELLESRRPKWSKPRRKWADRLLEDDAMAPVMDAPVDAPAEGGDPDQALLDGFRAAVMAIFDGEGSAADKTKKIGSYLRSHEKLVNAGEPEEPGDAEESEGDEDDDDKKKPKMESEELATLKREKAARELCESLGFNPTAIQTEAVAGIRDAKRQRELAESFKGKSASAGGFKSPKSAAPGSINSGTGDKKKRTATRETTESEVVPAADGMRTLMGD